MGEEPLLNVDVFAPYSHVAFDDGVRGGQNHSYMRYAHYVARRARRQSRIAPGRLGLRLRFRPRRVRWRNIDIYNGRTPTKNN